jgi:hypothetical protein
MKHRSELMPAERLEFGSDSEGHYLRMPQVCAAPYRFRCPPSRLHIEAWQPLYDWGSWFSVLDADGLNDSQIEEAMRNLARLGLDTGPVFHDDNT